jgi:hypothetical protein
MRLRRVTAVIVSTIAEIGSKTMRQPLDVLHRILADAPVSPQELRWAGWLVAFWFLIDLSQWLDWLVSKFH